PRQQTAQALHPPIGLDAGERQAVDYDDDYRALELEPGAPPREIADRVRLLRTVFDADGLPAELRRHAAARAQIVTDAAAARPRSCHPNGVAPPSAQHPPALAADPLAATAGLLAALGEALGIAGNDGAVPIPETPAGAGAKSAVAAVTPLHPGRADQTLPPAP